MIARLPLLLRCLGCLNAGALVVDGQWFDGAALQLTHFGSDDVQLGELELHAIDPMRTGWWKADPGVDELINCAY